MLLMLQLWLLRDNFITFFFFFASELIKVGAILWAFSDILLAKWWIE